jgi:hypothetical protein
VEFLTDQFFSTPDIVRRVQVQIRNKQVLVIVDPVSLLLDNIRSKIVSLAARSDRTAFCVLSPINMWELEANRWIEENARPDPHGIGNVFERFDSEWDWRCEFGVGDLRGLQRWFASVVRGIKEGLEPHPTKLEALRNGSPPARQMGSLLHDGVEDL